MSEELEFTGERFTPECVREIWYEHMHRYAFARDLVAGKRVLDAACGEGYGSSILSSTARSVLGVDIDEGAIEHARRKYSGRENLKFQLGDVTALENLPNAMFDVVTCFETLEHVEAQEDLLAGFVRLLVPDGILLVSSPDKAEYSDRQGFENEFHVRELYKQELVQLLGRHFTHVRLLGQKLLFQSVLWSTHDTGAMLAEAVTEVEGQMRPGLDYPPMYWVAICSRQSMPALPALHTFGDSGESVYTHYNAEVRKNMAAGRRIAELESQLTQSIDPKAKGRSWWQRILGRHR